MRTYYFLTHTPCGVGGGQRYVASKARWLLEHDWKVVIIGENTGEILLDYGNAEILLCNRINCVPGYVSKRARVGLLDKMADPCAGELVYIESHSSTLALWGELLALHLHATHLVYLLEEEPVLSCAEEVSFFESLLHQGRLAGISEKILRKMMCAAHAQVNEQDFVGCEMCAYNPTFIEDVPWTGDVRGDFTIGSVGRLDKQYVPLMLDSVKNFCAGHPSISVSLVMVGDAPLDSVRKRLERRIRDVENLRVHWLGYLSPVPLGLCEQFDVVVGKAGAATQLHEAGCRVITYAWDRDLCLGVLGEELLQNRVAEEGETGVDVSALLSREYRRASSPLAARASVRVPYCHVDYSDHLNRLDRVNNQVYFDVLTIKPGFAKRLTTYFVMLFGSRKLINGLKQIIAGN